MTLPSKDVGILPSTNGSSAIKNKMDHKGLGVGPATQGSLSDDVNSTFGWIDGHDDCDTANADEGDTGRSIQQVIQQRYSSDTATAPPAPLRAIPH